MKSILIDTDVILDVLLQREPFYAASREVLLRVQERKYRGYITTLAVANLFYLLRKMKGADSARRDISSLLQDRRYRIIRIDRRVLEAASDSPMTDFEDAIQAFAAHRVGLAIIVTRNMRDYVLAPLRAITPLELLAH